MEEDFGDMGDGNDDVAMRKSILDTRKAKVRWKNPKASL